MKLKVLGLSLVGAALMLVGYQKYIEYAALKSINSYQSCTAAKGSVIQETYPVTCVTQLGTRFNQFESIQKKDATIQNTPRGFYLSQFLASSNKTTYHDKEFNFSFNHFDSINIIKSTDNIGQSGTVSWVFSDKKLDFNILEDLIYAATSDRIYFLPQATKQSFQIYSKPRIFEDKIINGTRFATFYFDDENRTSYVTERNNGILVLSFNQYKPNDISQGIDQILSTFHFTD